MKHVNVGVASAEELEMSDYSLDISCSTVTQSASRLSEPDQEGSALLDTWTTVLKHKEEAERLTDCSTISSSDTEPENISRQHPHVLVVDSSHECGRTNGEMMTILKELDANCGISRSSANTAVDEPIVMTTVNNSNKGQISASNHSQNYVAALELPGISVYIYCGFQHGMNVIEHCLYLGI